MNERERLVEFILECDKSNEVLSCFNERPRKRQAAEIIADDLLANGALCPPCKVGSSVYRIVEMGTGIHYKQVGRCGIGHAEGYKIVPCEEKTKRFIRSVAVTKNNFFDVYENWGKTVFLSREEAEKALAERSKG